MIYVSGAIFEGLEASIDANAYIIYRSMCLNQ